MLMRLTLPAPARGRRALGVGPGPGGTMPRSFLVKTHSGHRVPNYGQLEIQRGRGCPQRPCGTGGWGKDQGAQETPVPRWEGCPLTQ